MSARIVFSGHMIFDGFASFDDAEAFADHVGAGFNRRVVVSTSRDDRLEPFPWQLTPPVVYVARADRWEDDAEQVIEREIERGAKVYGGRFAGT